MSSPIPYISVVGWVRNDGYTDRYLERIRHAIHFLADQFERFQVHAEIVVVEWNPPPDRPLVAELIGGGSLSNYVTIRFVVVDGRYHRSLEGADLKGMHVLNAANAGLRRARGQFIVPKALDTYFTDAIVEQIARRQLRNDEVYRCDRYDVSFEGESWLGLSRDELFRQMASNIAHHHERIKQSAHWAIRDLHTNACGDFTLMSGDIWQKIHGYQKDPTVLCLDADSIALHAAAAHGVREVCWPDNCRIYKVAHDHVFAPRVVQEWTGWQRRLDDFIASNFSWDMVVRLRIWLDYPRRRIRGLDGLLGPSIERNFVLKARRYAHDDTALVTNDDDWGLAREALSERIVRRASWDVSHAL